MHGCIIAVQYYKFFITISEKTQTKRTKNWSSDELDVLVKAWAEGHGSKTPSSSSLRVNKMCSVNMGCAAPC